ncbi:MAG: YfhO family protein [Caldilineaceae bacterium]|nr:YfhO family protein [Caldilineaceae bacterium]
MTSRKQAVRVLGVYLLLAGLFYAPSLLGLRTFPDGDFTHHFLPFSLFQQSEWLAARWLPVWNPYTYAGHPFLADIQAAVFYPLGNLLLLLTLPFTSPGARLYFLQAEAALHIALAGFFTHLLVQRLTGKRQAAFIAGLLFALSGYLTGYPPLQTAILRTAIWLPLILWLLVRAFDEPLRWRWWLGVSAAWATAFLAGHPQTFLHLSYTVVGWMGMLLWQSFLTQRHRQQTTIRPSLLATRILATCLLTFAFSAAQLLPSLEFTRQSVRASVDYAYVSGGFPVQDIWQMLFPGVLTQFSPLFIGIPGLFLALLSLGRVKSARHSLFFVLLSFLALLLSFGNNGFLYSIFYRLAPGWDLFRGQERAAFLVAFGLSVLAGYGMAGLPEMRTNTRKLAGAVLIALISGGLFLFGFVWQWEGRGALPNKEFLRVALLSGLIGLAVVWLLWQKKWETRHGWALAALGVASLLWANGGTNVDSADPAHKTRLAPEVAAVQALADGARVYNEYRVYEDYGMSIAAEDVWGSSPLRLARYAALFDNFPLDRMWRLLGVETVLTWRRELPIPSDLIAEFPQATDTTFLHRLVAANPRAWLVQNVQIADDAAALALLADHNFDLNKTALLPPDTALSFDANTPPSQPPTIRLDRAAPNRVHIILANNPGGLLVLSENWLPGWRAHTLLPTRHSPLPVFRANLTQIAIPVPAGDLSLELVYWPDSLNWGLAITGSALFVVCLGFLYRRRQTRG